MGEFDSAARIHGRLGGLRDNLEHESCNHDGQDREKGVIAELRKPSFKEALGALETAQESPRPLPRLASQALPR
jgi:hypothetical protein